MSEIIRDTFIALHSSDVLGKLDEEVNRCIFVSHFANTLMCVGVHKIDTGHSTLSTFSRRDSTLSMLSSYRPVVLEKYNREIDAFYADEATSHG